MYNLRIHLFCKCIALYQQSFQDAIIDLNQNNLNAQFEDQRTESIGPVRHVTLQHGYLPKLVR